MRFVDCMSHFVSFIILYSGFVMFSLRLSLSLFVSEPLRRIIFLNKSRQAGFATKCVSIYPVFVPDLKINSGFGTNPYFPPVLTMIRRFHLKIDAFNPVFRRSDQCIIYDI